jgi:hypothetical protein
MFPKQLKEGRNRFAHADAWRMKGAELSSQALSILDGDPLSSTRLRWAWVSPLLDAVACGDALPGTSRQFL